MIDAANERGWELVAHNYVQTDLLTNYFEDPDGERKIILETLRVFEDAVGRPAKGWLSSSLRCNASTVETIAEQGADLYQRLHERRPALSDPHRERAGGLGALFQRGPTTSPSICAAA